MSIVTKTGDKGETSLMYNRRVSKGDTRVDAYGCVDELTAALGLARSISNQKFLSEQILGAQKDLIVVMADRITAVISDLEKDKSLYPKDWVIPGGTAVSAALDFARTTCRRAERHIATFSADEKDFNPEILRYLNRLSDLCWVLARYAERTSPVK